MRALDDHAYTAVALGLARQGMQAGLATRLPVTGTSMLPLLQPGDAVWLESVAPASLQPGDLLVIRQDGVLLTHRLIAGGAAGWQTKGDNNRLPDPPVATEAIQGRVVTLERSGTLIPIQSRHWIMANRLVASIGWLESRLREATRSRYPESKLLRYLGEAPFRLLSRAVMVLALRF